MLSSSSSVHYERPPVHLVFPSLTLVVTLLIFILSAIIRLPQLWLDCAALRQMQVGCGVLGLLALLLQLRILQHLRLLLLLLMNRCFTRQLLFFLFFFVVVVVFFLVHWREDWEWLRDVAQLLIREGDLLLLLLRVILEKVYLVLLHLLRWHLLLLLLLHI